MQRRKNDAVCTIGKQGAGIFICSDLQAPTGVYSQFLRPH